MGGNDLRPARKGDKVKDMSQEDALGLIGELQEQNAALRVQVAAQQRQNERLVERIGELEQKIAELAALKTPPPPWAKANRPKPEKPAGTPRKKRAPTHDHGRRRSTPTRIVAHAYDRCPDCAYALAGTAVARRREVIEIPPTAVEVVEHQVLKRYCPACGAWKTPAVSFEGITLGQGRLGVRLASLIGTLRMTHRLPLAHIQRLLTQVYGLHLSVGGMLDLLARLRERLAPTREEIRAQTRASPSQHIDETGWREDGQNGYIWAQATAGPTATREFTYVQSRAGAVADRLLDGYEGVVVSDGYAAYDHLLGPKQRCWAHILRAAHKLTKGHPEDAPLRVWVDGLKGLYAQAVAVATNAGVTERQRAAAANDAERRVRTLARCYRRAQDHPAHALARWLHTHEGELFTFVRTPGVSGTNNLAERTVRPFVIGRKISGGSRSPHGSAMHCDLATVFHTWAARGLDPLAACLATLQSPLPQV